MNPVTSKNKNYTINGTLVDQLTKPTRRPGGPLVYTIASNGVSVTGPTSKAFSLINNFWKASSVFNFKPTYKNDNGKIITITATCPEAIGTYLFNIDLPEPLIQCVPASGLQTTTSGGTATFDVRLSVEPESDVVVDIESSSLLLGTVDKSSLTFTTDNWNTYQTVTITGQDGNGSESEVPYFVNLTATSIDIDYDGLTAAVSVTNNKSSYSVKLIFSQVAEYSATGDGQAQATSHVGITSGAENYGYVTRYCGNPPPSEGVGSFIGSVTGSYTGSLNGSGDGEISHPVSSYPLEVSIQLLTNAWTSTGEDSAASDSSVSCTMNIYDGETLIESREYNIESHTTNGGTGFEESETNISIAFSEEGSYTISES
jgi:hypothetical protein